MLRFLHPKKRVGKKTKINNLQYILEEDAFSLFFMNLSLNLLKNKKRNHLLNNQFDLKKKLEIHDLAFIKKTNSFKFLKKSHVTNKWISWINKLNLEPTLLNNQTFYENKRREQNLKKNPIYK